MMHFNNSLFSQNIHKTDWCNFFQCLFYKSDKTVLLKPDIGSLRSVSCNLHFKHYNTIVIGKKNTFVLAHLLIFLFPFPQKHYIHIGNSWELYREKWQFPLLALWEWLYLEQNMVCTTLPTILKTTVTSKKSFCFVHLALVVNNLQTTLHYFNNLNR